MVRWKSFSLSWETNAPADDGRLVCDITNKLMVLFCSNIPLLQKDNRLFSCNSVHFWKRKIETTGSNMTTHRTTHIQTMLLLNNSLAMSLLVVAYCHHTDLTARFFCGGYLKDKVYSNRPRTLEYTKEI